MFTMENQSVLCSGIKHKEFSFLGLFSVVSKHFPYLALMDLNWGWDWVSVSSDLAEDSRRHCAKDTIAIPIKPHSRIMLTSNLRKT